MKERLNTGDVVLLSRRLYRKGRTYAERGDLVRVEQASWRVIRRRFPTRPPIIFRTVRLICENGRSIPYSFAQRDIGGQIIQPTPASACANV